MPQTDIAASADGGPRSRMAGIARRIRDSFVLKAHGVADRMDRLPTEFGKNGPVDETDAQAVSREWLRCLRVWADDSPEEVFAYKVGGGFLAAVILGLLLLVGMIA